jgi:DNA polymerase-3 subunit alpha
VGTHAGGVLIAPSKISDFCPIYKAGAEDGVVSQFDMKDVEALGLVKFDFLGLSNLTVIDKTVKLVHEKGLSEDLIDIDTLPLDDARVYELLQACNTTGIFQLESEGMRGYLKKLQADSFEDIVAMLALYRPGPLDAGMVDDYINVKHGRQKIKYPHPMLKDILQPTNGVFLYQEQVMKSAQVMAGYSLGGADLLRRAMGKKIAEEMDAQRDVFVKGAAKHEIDTAKANEIFDLIDKFSGYGFNKSHSVAYAYVSYQTAWLKAHYPAAFMACVLSGLMTDTDRVSWTVGETQAMGLIVRAPNINESIYEFSIQDEKILTYGLGAIKGVGESLVEALVSEREEHGDYQNLFDFCMRIEKKTLNKRALEALIYSGALDVFKIDRAVLIKTYPSAMRQAEQQQNDRLSGQSGLFSDVPECSEYEINYLSAPAFSFGQTLQFEKQVMGYYFYNHPTDEYKCDLQHITATLPSELAYRNNREARVLGLLSDVYYRNTKNGNTMASITLEDSKTTLNGVIFSKVLNAQTEEEEAHSVSDVLVVDTVVVASGKIERDEYRDGWQLVVDKIEAIGSVKEKYAKSFEVLLSNKHLSLFEKLAALLKQNPGKCPVRLHYQVAKSRGYALLDEHYRVRPSQQLADEVNTLLDFQASHVSY